MLINGLAKINEFLRKHSTARGPMARWTRITAHAAWCNIIDVRKVFPTADAIGTKTCFNIGGGNYRLMALISYQRQEVMIDELLTHAEYDKKYVR